MAFLPRAVKPGETTTVRFSIQPDDLKFYDVVTRDWKEEPGGFTAYIGSSSRDIRLMGRFTLASAAAAF
jgi:beta-glucosidase